VKKGLLITFALSLMSGMIGAVPVCFADNPIVQTKYTADPAPFVYNDTVYLYTSHDEDTAVNFTMYNWMLYTTTDMANWTDHGIVAGVKAPNNTFPWAAGYNAWAPQVIERNGKFYLYVPIQGGGAMTIAVAVADSPFGPFKDALGKALVTTGTSDDIDPTVYIDSDGKAYLYWGNPNCHFVTLNSDMISYSGSIGTTPKIQSYQEGPWFYKRGSNYYLAFASTCCPEGIGYAMSSSPTGPWTYKGSIMDGNTQSSGNHPGIIDYKGSSYVFGFNYNVQLQREGQRLGERRSIAVEKLSYNTDGTIPKLPFWSKTGPDQIESLNPYVQTEAETIAWAWDVKTETCSEGGMDVTAIENGDFIKVKGVDFGAGATSLDVRVASASSGGNIDIRLDSQTGKLVGTCAVSGTGGAQAWATKSCAISGASGIHDVFFVFTGGSGSLFNFNWWKFRGDPGIDAGVGTGGATSTGGRAATGGTSGANGGTGGATGGNGAGGRSSSSAGTSSVASTGGASTGGASSGGASASGGRFSSGGTTSVVIVSGGTLGSGGTTYAATSNSSGTGGINGGASGSLVVATGGTPRGTGGSTGTLGAGGDRAGSSATTSTNVGVVNGAQSNPGSGCGCTIPGKTRTTPAWIWSLASLFGARYKRRCRSKRNLVV
jgi:arabinoxylan arabinofuranohydrolase